MHHKGPGFFCFLAILVIITGCAPRGEIATKVASQSKSNPGCLDPDGPVTLTIHDWSSPDRQIYWEQAVQAFESTHPCIVIETVHLREDRTARLNELATGYIPDLIGFDISDLARMSQLGYLMDLTPIMNQDHFNPADEFYDSIVKAGMIDGKVLGLAKDYSVSTFYVNTDLLAKAGIRIPTEGWTYDDYLKMAQQLTLDQNGNNATSPQFNANNIAVWGTILGEWVTDSGWWRGFQSFLYSWGAHTISPDGMTTSGYINSDKAIAAWTWYRDLIHKYHVAPTVSYFNSTGISDDKLFSQGKIAISGAFWGPWYQDTFNQAQGLKWRAVPLPTGPGGHWGAIMWMGWGISAKTEHAAQAWELLKWLTTDPGQTIFAKKALSGDKNILETLQMDKDPYWGVFLAEVPHQDKLDDLTTPFYTTCVDGPASKLVGKVEQNDASLMNIKSELDKLAAQADQCLAKSRAQSPK